LPGGSASSSSRQRRVVACAPVPKARPGSTTTASTPAGGSSQGGPTQSRPTRTGRWNSRQRSSQPASTSLACASGKAASTRRVAVRGELDLPTALRLFEPLGRQLDEARTQLLEKRGRCGDRGADQRKALLSLRMKPSSESS